MSSETLYFVCVICVLLYAYKRLVHKTKRRCHYCRCWIYGDAKVCPVCHRSQSVSFFSIIAKLVVGFAALGAAFCILLNHAANGT